MQFTEIKLYKLSIVHVKYVWLPGKLSRDTGLKDNKHVCRQDSLQITWNKAMKQHGIHDSTATRRYKGEAAEDEFKVSQRGIVRLPDSHLCFLYVLCFVCIFVLKPKLSLAYICF